MPATLIEENNAHDMLYSPRSSRQTESLWTVGDLGAVLHAGLIPPTKANPSTKHTLSSVLTCVFYWY